MSGLNRVHPVRHVVEVMGTIFTGFQLVNAQKSFYKRLTNEKSSETMETFFSLNAVLLAYLMKKTLNHLSKKKDIFTAMGCDGDGQSEKPWCKIERFITENANISLPAIVAAITFVIDSHTIVSIIGQAKKDLESVSARHLSAAVSIQLFVMLVFYRIMTITGFMPNTM